jgi:hypothetical protein
LCHRRNPALRTGSHGGNRFGVLRLRAVRGTSRGAVDGRIRRRTCWYACGVPRNVRATFTGRRIQLARGPTRILYVARHAFQWLSWACFSLDIVGGSVAPRSKRLRMAPVAGRQVTMVILEKWRGHSPERRNDGSESAKIIGGLGRDGR